jgi:hypothetical protein
MVQDTFLNDTWRAFFHGPSDPSWTYDSYIPIATVGSVDDYWKLYNTIETTLSDGMYFVMREHVFPCWDDQYNINGGNISIKVSHEDTKTVVTDMIRSMMGETLLKKEYIGNWADVNGLSVSPKKAFNIVKIWLGSDTLSNPEVFNLPVKYASSAMFTSFRAQIEASKAR